LSRLLEGRPLALAHRLDLPGNADVQRLVEEVERNGDDPAAYLALAEVIRERQLSAGQDNPSIRARIALLDLDELLNPVLTRLDGTRVRLNDYRYKPVLLAFGRLGACLAAPNLPGWKRWLLAISRCWRSLGSLWRPFVRFSKSTRRSWQCWLIQDTSSAINLASILFRERSLWNLLREARSLAARLGTAQSMSRFRRRLRWSR
jgi:hypothetical protein